MLKRKPLKIIAAALTVGVLASYGCILNPDSGGGGEDVTIDWPDLTDREDIVETISLVYENYNRVGIDELMTHYSNTMYEDPSGQNSYIWNMQEGDIIQGHNPVMTRSEDLAGTRGILTNASNLNLEISSGTWSQNQDICEECWETTRLYTINATFPGEGEPITYNGVNMRVNFVVGPNTEDPGTWAIYIASDLPGVN